MMELRSGKWHGQRDDGVADFLGTFVVTSGKFVVSDPCYKRGTWCMGVLDNVRNGKWEAEAVRSNEGSWGERVAELIAYTGRAPKRDAAWEKCEFEIGVDSGQAGIFDDAHYRVDEDTKGYKHTYRESHREADGTVVKADEPTVIRPEEPWYSMCCDLTGTSGAGVVPGGVVATSGFGDGGYDAFVVKDKGKIVAVRIVFITEGETDEGAEETEDALFGCCGGCGNGCDDCDDDCDDDGDADDDCDENEA